MSDGFAHDLNPDYGEDLFVFVYDGRIATGDLFFVQIKATEGTSTQLAYRLGVATVRRWSRLSVRVVLIHYTSTPTVRSHWSVFRAMEWRELLASVPEGQVTLCVPQDQSTILNDTSAGQLQGSG